MNIVHIGPGVEMGEVQVLVALKLAEGVDPVVGMTAAKTQVRTKQDHVYQIAFHKPRMTSDILRRRGRKFAPATACFSGQNR
ncbi:MAG: hypothetical protein P8Y01_07815 [Woeseiaceae bacterium]